MQEDLIQLTEEWVALDDYITVESDINYFIQNRGQNVLITQVASSKPEASDMDGDLILPYIQALYKKGTGNLYMRAFNNTCSVNVTKGE